MKVSEDMAARLTDEEVDSVKNNVDEISPALKMPAEWRLVLKDGYEQRMGNMN